VGRDWLAVYSRGGWGGGGGGKKRVLYAPVQQGEPCLKYFIRGFARGDGCIGEYARA